MHSVAETTAFTRRADALLSGEERDALIDLLAWNPLVGVVIPGTGGVRKLRFGAGGRGKRGAFRVVYYVLADELPIVAIMIYGKNEKADPTPAERIGLRRIVEELKGELQRRRAAAEERRTTR